MHTRIHAAEREMLPVFVICGDSNNLLLWPRKVRIQYSFQTSGKTQPTKSAAGEDHPEAS